MAQGKLYIGRKVRELRVSKNATQAQLADRLGISISYLNQIENNQRPLSATVLLALAEEFKLTLADLAEGEDNRLMSALSEAISDPFFSLYAVSPQQLKLVSKNAPGIAHALIAVHQAYRHNSEQLASIEANIGISSGLVEKTPYEEVRDYFHFVDNYVNDLDLFAENLATELQIGAQDTHVALSTFLQERCMVRIERTSDTDVMRQFDMETRTLTLNSYLPSATRDFQIALQIAQLHAGAMIDEIAAAGGFRTAEAVEICRIGLHNYFAGALVMPYRKFLEIAQEVRHDLDLLSARFGASLEQVCHRLSTLQRPGEKGTPIYFARIDRAGNITKRHSAVKLQFARFGAACPLWNAHRAFESSKGIIRQLAETPDGVRYLCIATHVAKGARGFLSARQDYVLALGCEISYADKFVYADGLDLKNHSAFEPIGISCRICERPNCASRAVPPIKSQLVIQHNMRGLLPYGIRDTGHK
ncbi:DUF2083 domain-containing protein [Rhizobium sp. 16-449-1b]|uniref:helix-turn-helix domain-containing protein n=1 Tax=Rhizobium sp. 16-449-1b TaxID=2819989 RepID=UPI001AD9BB15|nr:helix-turn-helix transcriptional regulator [Rhizobium sp. 16-449-1b]MBO9195429.1 DUF2083 domain-containing protein [Rhizobium sp. 16-449-1b]